MTRYKHLRIFYTSHHIRVYVYIGAHHTALTYKYRVYFLYYNMINTCGVVLLSQLAIQPIVTVQTGSILAAHFQAEILDLAILQFLLMLTQMLLFGCLCRK